LLIASSLTILSFTLIDKKFWMQYIINFPTLVGIVCMVYPDHAICMTSQHGGRPNLKAYLNINMKYMTVWDLTAECQWIAQPSIFWCCNLVPTFLAFTALLTNVISFFSSTHGDSGKDSTSSLRKSDSPVNQLYTSHD